MITPEVMGHIDPAGSSGLSTEGKLRSRQPDRLGCRLVPRQEYDDSEADDASPFLIGLATRFACAAQRRPSMNGMAIDLGALGGTRTPNLLIRSQMLYPLSYER